MRYDSRLMHLPFVMIRMHVQACAVRFWPSTNRYNSLSFVMKFRFQLATIRNCSQTIATIRHGIVLHRLICKLVGHNLITCDLKC